MREIDLAYVAGIIDGEGSICITKESKLHDRRATPKYFLSVSVGNSNEWLIYWLCNTFGGSFCFRGRLGFSNLDIWVWQITQAGACQFLKLILPYLRLKHPQAELAIDFQSHRGRRGKKRTLMEVQLDEIFRQKMGILNKGG